MKFIAITQPTASWLLTRTTLLNSIHDLLRSDEQLAQLRNADLIQGSFRISGSPDSTLLAIWNLDYLTGTGIEEWGFLKRMSPLGLHDNAEISQAVFEREIYVINQRLQNLLIDSAYHRKGGYSSGAQTCMAGRGDDARHSSIGYFESDVIVGTNHSRSIICVGPSTNYDVVANAAAEEAKRLPALVKMATDMIAPQRRRPALDSSVLTEIRSEAGHVEVRDNEPLQNVTVSSLGVPAEARDVYRTLAWSYEDWKSSSSPLSSTQRRILESDGILNHPIRIMGPGGSGKTLLMQLLAFRRLAAAADTELPLKVLYIVHNAPMARQVRDRFDILGAEPFLRGTNQTLTIQTLAEYGKAQLQLADTGIINADAHETKLFQLEQVKEALKKTLQSSISEVRDSTLLTQVAQNEDLFLIFSTLVMAEFSTAIKGHGLTSDEKRYVGSEKPLSRLHGVLSQPERGIIFRAFVEYHKQVFETFEVLDSDDIALSLLGKMRTPIWELKRKDLGFDFIFVDETQLFNENERRLFSLMTKGTSSYVPIVLALDDAQEIYGQSSAGFGALGITAITNENLASSHRSTKDIIELAFFVIQKSTDLFGPDFPDFTGCSATMERSDHELAAKPRIERCTDEVQSFSRFVLKRIRDLRKDHLKQIAVICHAEYYWDDLVRELKASDLPLHILVQRGESLTINQPLIVLTRPAYVGGQEFDAVLAVGLEHGLVPPLVHDNQALASAVEQQSLREMYLSFTRARFQIRILLNKTAQVTRVIKEAVDSGLVDV
jgi:hypothetical protein